MLGSITSMKCRPRREAIHGREQAQPGAGDAEPGGSLGVGADDPAFDQIVDVVR